MIGFKISINNKEIITKADSLISIHLDVSQMERMCLMTITERNIKTVKYWSEISLKVGDVVRITTVKTEKNDSPEPVQHRNLERLKNHYYKLRGELKDKGLIV